MNPLGSGENRRYFKKRYQQIALRIQVRRVYYSSDTNIFSLHLKYIRKIVKSICNQRASVLKIIPV